jgi:hypothetical protein
MLMADNVIYVIFIILRLKVNLVYYYIEWKKISN